MIDRDKAEEFLNSKPPIGTLMGFQSYRHWLADVLITLHKEGEMFSGKRPNCDSGWEYDLAIGLSLIEPGIVTAWETYYDEDPIATIDWEVCHNVFRQAIRTIFGLDDD